jgi:hypothetical protein
MAGNSWDLVESGGKRWLSGSSIEMLPAEERSGWAIADTTVSNVWEPSDLTSIIGTDVLMVTGFLQIGAYASADDKMIVNVKAIGDSQDHGEESRVGILYSDTVYVPANLGSFTMFDCKGTDPGKLQYREYSASYQIDSFHFVVWGRIRP